MSTEHALTSQKLKPGERSFLDLPAETRNPVYRQYFAGNEQEVNLTISSGIALPCPEGRIFHRVLEKRMKAGGITWGDIGRNPTIALLLACKAIYSEAIVRLFEEKTFHYAKPVTLIDEIPLSIVSRMRALDLCGETTVHHITGREVDIIHDYLYFHRLQSEVADAWYSMIDNARNLQTLRINFDRIESSDSDLQFFDLYRHWAEDALFKSAATRVYFEVHISSEHPYKFWSYSGRTISDVHEWMWEHKCLRVPPIARSRILPAVESITVNTSVLRRETLLGLKYGGCELVKVAEARLESLPKFGWLQETYEVIWPKKKLI